VGYKDAGSRQDLEGTVVNKYSHSSRFKQSDDKLHSSVQSLDQAFTHRIL
jgi:hypothetical protein